MLMVCSLTVCYRRGIEQFLFNDTHPHLLRQPYMHRAPSQKPRQRPVEIRLL